MFELLGYFPITERLEFSQVLKPYFNYSRISNQKTLTPPGVGKVPRIRQEQALERAIRMGELLTKHSIAMNSTSRALLQTVVSTDVSLSPAERGVIEQLMSGIAPMGSGSSSADPEKLSVTQKKAADILSVNRVTIWRMTKDSVLHPVEILPGTWRYPYRELATLAAEGIKAVTRARPPAMTAA